MKERFDQAEIDGFAEILRLRRDIRHFRSDPVPEDVLQRLFAAAHLAPSVGLSQPWRFVVLDDRDKRRRIRESFLACRAAEAARFEGERRKKYLSLKLEGIEDAPINLCVCADLRPRGPILGTTSWPEALRWSVCCAVQNLWLMARAEGVGVGWVSIAEPQVLRDTLELPYGVEPLAYLCLGYPQKWLDRPLLAAVGWEERLPVSAVVHRDGWQDEVDAELPWEHDVSPEAQARAHRDLLAKPPGAMGRFEELHGWYVASHGAWPPPDPDKLRLVTFAADHGVTVHGVSSYASSVTAGMVRTMLAGRSAVSVLCSEERVEHEVVDVGVAGALDGLPDAPGFVSARVRAGTRDLSTEDALTADEVSRALEVGAEAARRAHADGVRGLAVGEVGIGNTTASAALLAALTDTVADQATGRGTGLDEAGRSRKAEVVARAVARVSGRDVNGVLAGVGGLEILAMAGCILEARRLRLPVVVDGFISGVAALVAERLSPGSAAGVLVSHRSAESGTQALLDALSASGPVLDLGLRMGEGTGAVLALGMLRAAVRVHQRMSPLALAGVVR